MPVPPAQADIKSNAAIRTANRISAIAFFFRRFEPATSIPNKPSPWSCIHTAYIGGSCRAGKRDIASDVVAVVLIVTVTVAGFEPGVTGLDDMLQADLAGAPLQARAIALLNPPSTPATTTEYVAVDPALTVSLVEELVRPKSVPVPLNATLCGLPAALSVIVSAPVRLPADFGLKEMLNVQLALAVRVPEQLLVWV